MVGDNFTNVAKPGDTVYLCTAANSGYVFSKWETNGSVEIKDNSFIMPDHNVSLKAVFEVPSDNPSTETKIVYVTSYVIPKTGIK